MLNHKSNSEATISDLITNFTVTTQSGKNYRGMTST